MKNDLLNINKIFTDRLFRIPDYQRGYAWSKKQLKDFWNDLRQLEHGKNHYVGVLTLEDVNESIYSNWSEDLWIIKSKSFAPYYIVDGQQRLTTSILLIQAILETNHSGKKLNYSTNDEIKKRFIFDSKDDGISRSYIFGYEKDNPSYEFLKVNIFQEQTDIDSRAQDTIYTQNLFNAKSFFKERLEKLPFTEIEDVFKKVTQHFLFNIYSMSDDIDVYITFETMNNRGKQLSILELLKNRLIFLSTKLRCDENDSNKLRFSINEAWKSVYHFLGKNKDRRLDDDTFLLNHFFYYFGEKVLNDSEHRFRYHHRNLRGLYQSYLLDNLFTIRNLDLSLDDGNNNDNSFNLNIDVSVIYDYVKSIKSSVQTWFDILNPTLSNFSQNEIVILERIYRIERNAEDEIFMILILVFYEKVKDTSDRVKLLNNIENMLFVNTLVEYRWTLDWNDDEFLRLSINLASGAYDKDKVFNDLHAMWSSSVNSKTLTQSMTKKFNMHGFYHWEGIRYFLYEYEEELRGKSKTKRVKLNWQYFKDEDEFDYISVEHIYPQTARRQCWSTKYNHYNQKQRAQLKNSLGNLVPLSKPKNSSLSNKCFEEKKSRENDTVGFAFGCYSENEVALKENWTAIEILERGIKMANFFQKRWGIKFDDNNQLLKFLGIDFVIDKEKLNIDDYRELTKKSTQKNNT
ncbi:GmrSD restriction endonuclease domain-containing protein [Aeromonas veronii]|uniref:DUF262 domain-containing protein n=2 Tax=Aeromonas veronii TaxID=654 RepID=UPI00142FB53B|nr:DUF262 domain-containing protein [Aeromonas veronii]